VLDAIGTVALGGVEGTLAESLGGAPTLAAGLALAEGDALADTGVEAPGGALANESSFGAALFEAVIARPAITAPAQRAPMAAGTRRLRADFVGGWGKGAVAEDCDQGALVTAGSPTGGARIAGGGAGGAMGNAASVGASLAAVGVYGIGVPMGSGGPRMIGALGRGGGGAADVGLGAGLGGFGSGGFAAGFAAGFSAPGGVQPAVETPST
jgi:hypothetical protein